MTVKHSTLSKQTQRSINSRWHRRTARRYAAATNTIGLAPTDSSAQVTTDPETLNNPKNENPGIVPKDSLAGESIREGGSFAANADARGPMDQKAAGLTANTTDTSGATRLDPAVDAEARQASEEWGESAKIHAGAELGKQAGVGPTYNTPSGGAGAGSGGMVSGDQIADTTNQASTGAAIPPSVAGGPKGANLTEGGFDESAPHAKFDVEPGSKQDTGRQALLDTDVPVSGGAGPRQGGVSGDGQFDALKDERA